MEKRGVGKTHLTKDFMLQIINNNLVDTFVIFTSDHNTEEYCSFFNMFDETIISITFSQSLLKKDNIESKIENILYYQDIKRKKANK